MDLLIDWTKSDKELFVQYYDLIKIKSTRQENIEKLKQLEKHFNNEANIREHKQLLKLTVDFCEMKDRTINLTCASWDNIKRAVKVYRQAMKNSKDNAEEFCETLKSSTWEKGMSCYRYNQILTDKLKAIKKSYIGVMEKPVLELDEILQSIELLSIEDKKTILLKLANELKINLPESHL